MLLSFIVLVVSKTTQWLWSDKNVCGVFCVVVCGDDPGRHVCHRVGDPPVNSSKVGQTQGAVQAFSAGRYEASEMSGPRIAGFWTSVAQVAWSHQASIL